MNTEAMPWQIIVPFIGMISAALVQLYIAKRNKIQIEKQFHENISIQQFMSNRTTASFIADKRQKWIDELRTEMACHLAQSKEIIWKWDAVRSRAALEIQEKSEENETAQKILQDAADSFSPENGQRDREHEERHIRIKFRLNPEENLHIDLRKCLDDIRIVLDKTQGAKNKDEAKKLIYNIHDLVDNSTKITEKILKGEWERLKQEVAYPDALIAKIEKPKKK